MQIKSKFRILNIIILVLLLVLTLTACQQDDQGSNFNKDSNLDSDVEEFIYSFNFPDIYSIRVLHDIPENKLQIFSITYGFPMDCPSGCIFSNARGLKYNNQIGWIRIDDYHYQKDLSPYYYNLGFIDDNYPDHIKGFLRTEFNYYHGF